MACSMAKKEFKFTTNDFKFLQNIVYAKSGIVLSKQKEGMVYARLVRRLRKLELLDFKEYCNLIKSGDKEELSNLVNIVTTNVTNFFREKHHFSYLEEKIFPNVINNCVDVWSAGCSTGQEPYSISYTASKFKNLNVSILATDLDTNVLQTAVSAVYE